MTTDTEKTQVIFRMWRATPKTCLALFPYVDAGRGFCQSYEHTGQHSGATYSHIIRVTRPATPAEYADLKAELETIGYNLQVINRRARR